MWEMLEFHDFPGNFPVRLAWEMMNLFTFFKWATIIRGLLALTRTPVTLRSVTFCKWLSQTPVNFLKLLKQAKDLRFEANSGGKEMGEIGQLMNWRSWREDIDLRAVNDRETSSEQFIRWSEVRCLKGLELSQWMILWIELEVEHGSFVVGMLRDWRALSCLGSSVDEGEEEEEEEDGGVGEIEGGLVGEMGGDRVCVGCVFKRRVKSRKMGMKNGGSSMEEWGKNVAKKKRFLRFWGFLGEGGVSLVVRKMSLGENLKQIGSLKKKKKKKKKLKKIYFKKKKY